MSPRDWILVIGVVLMFCIAPIVVFAWWCTGSWWFGISAALVGGIPGTVLGITHEGSAWRIKS